MRSMDPCRRWWTRASRWSWLVGLVLCLGDAGEARGQLRDSLTLPLFELQIAPEHLAELDADPYADVLYPATLTAGGETYPCEVRYRGATSRELPKKGWRLEFEDDENPFGTEKVNLRADYRDDSFLRNHLTHRLFDFLGVPAPKTRFVNLFVNDRHAGVFIEAERIDEDFLERHDLPFGSLYKPIMHVGSMAPLLDFSYYRQGWEARGRTTSDFRPVQELVSQVAFLSDEEFAGRVGALFDLDNLLTYYAVQFALYCADAATGNFYMACDPGGRCRLIPWDMDTSLGLDWAGKYQPAYETIDDLHQHGSVLLQRLLSFEAWQQQFLEKVRYIADRGFPVMRGELEEAYLEIRNDVRLDTTKRASNEGFEASVEEIRTFLDRRAAFLSTWSGYTRPPAEVTVSTPFPTAEEPEVTVRVHAPGAASVRLRLYWGIDYRWYAVGSQSATYEMHDDGGHDDLSAGDGTFGVRLDLTEHLGGGLLPFAAEVDGRLYPSMAPDYGWYLKTPGYAFNAYGTPASEYEQLTVGAVYRAGEERYIELRNRTGHTVDLAYSYLQAGSSHRRLPFPPGARIAPGGALIVAAAAETATRRFPELPVVSGLFFDVLPGDTLRLLSPVHVPLVKAVVPEFSQLPGAGRVVINEINYNPPSDLDTEDWVELYNPESTEVDVAGWVFQDAEAEHRFVLPAGTVIPAGGFLVLARDTAVFRDHFPEQGPAVGDLGFGLSGDGEHLRLYNLLGELVDEVTYGSAPPWPPAADGEGPTLELIDATHDNRLAASWAPSRLAGGTPGSSNSVSVGRERPGVPDEETAALGPGYPNPFFDELRIPYTLGQTGSVSVALYDLRGREVLQLQEGVRPPGSHTARLVPHGLAAGVYLYVLEVDGHAVGRGKAVFLR